MIRVSCKFKPLEVGEVNGADKVRKEGDGEAGPGYHDARAGVGALAVGIGWLGGRAQGGLVQNGW